DRVLGEGREDLAVALRKRIQSRLDELDAGVEVLFVGIEGVHPPRETAATFETVVQSGQRRETTILAAQMQADKDLIDVAGSVEMARLIVGAIKDYEVFNQGGPQSGKEAEFVARQRELERGVEDLLLKAGGQAAKL